jgi:hypothetical protein
MIAKLLLTATIVLMTMLALAQPANVQNAQAESVPIIGTEILMLIGVICGIREILKLQRTKKTEGDS